MSEQLDVAGHGAHDVRDVERIVETLQREGLRIWLFGAWAEELHGLAEPGPHGDIDLLYVAPGFEEIDELVARTGWREVKRLPHKRAFELFGVVVDVFLVRRDEEGFYSEFFGLRHSWPDDVVSDSSPVPLASSASVRGFRQAFARLLVRHRTQAQD